MENFSHSIHDFIQKKQSIGREAIDAFLSHGKPRHFKKKEVFIGEGDICTKLLYIKKGLFRYYYVLEDGSELIKDFAIDQQNPFCTAYTSFITHQPSQIWIDALEDSDVLIWTEDYISSLFNQSPWLEFSKKIVEGMFIRKEKREFAFLRMSPEERYKQFLQEYPRLDQRIPQYQIASFLGIVPESLSRIRKRKTS